MFLLRNWIILDLSTQLRACTASLDRMCLSGMSCHVLAGSSALYSARNLVAGGLARCTLALGFEKMQKGSLQLDDPGDVNPLGEPQGVK